MKKIIKLSLAGPMLAGLLAILSACTTTQVADCDATLRSGLESAIRTVDAKLANGCEYHFDQYFAELLDVAASNPSADNKRVFSDFLIRSSDRGTISKRQASEIYNRYFNIKFVSLTGDYNTCSQTCPTRRQVLADMQSELGDKQLGLVQASEDNAAYYRADLLLKEAQLVLEATCSACEAGGY